MADFDYTTGEDHQVPVNIEDEMTLQFIPSAARDQWSSSNERWQRLLR